MNFLEAAILGLVEGITEFLPVSSTGHLVVVQRMLGIESSDAANSFAIVIQIGAILAILRLYGGRVKQMINGLRGRDEEGKNLLFCLIVAFLPAAFFGLLLNDWIESVLFGPIPIIFAWFVGGVYILWWSSKVRDPERGRPLSAMHWRAALGIGLFQCLALWPGTSRSLVTIFGGTAVGLTLVGAVEFSFLLGGITLSAASIYSGLKNFDSLGADVGFGVLAVGVLVSFFSALVAVRWMVDWIKKKGMAVFGYWRILAAIIVGLMVWSGRM